MLTVIVTCGNRKRKVRSFVRDLYSGPYVRKCLELARVLSKEPRIFILSGKYGLLRLDQKIRPYDSAKFPAVIRSGWFFRLVKLQSKRYRVGDHPVILGGDKSRYGIFCHNVWPNATYPLSGVGSIGKQLQRLNILIRARRI